MNPNLAEVGKPTRWPPGQSANPAGKPPGTRTAFSQGFIRDFALVWAEEGLEAVRKVAKNSPEAFVAIAARICPSDVRLTLEQAIPGGMSLEDYLLMREVIAAIREGLPEAVQMQPGQVFQHVLEALHDCRRRTEIRTVLFASFRVTSMAGVFHWLRGTMVAAMPLTPMSSGCTKMQKARGKIPGLVFCVDR
jgi:hypothetical protein